MNDFVENILQNKF